MPRGFLVKRNRRSGGSYRIPCEDHGPPLHPRSPIKPPGPEIIAPITEHRPPAELSPIRAGGGVEPAEPWIPRSPAQPEGLELKRTFFQRFLSSPVAAESFPVSASFTPMEKLLSHHKHYLSPEKFPPKSKVPPKKHKASRRLQFADDVTTSPVLGLKIKAEEPEAKSRSPLVKRPPLGEFICQLCKEQYPDPFALAQHKCSRIVRVEYRCPECEKIFSCPANLASHRRWHKPRALGSDGPGGRKLQAALEGKENSTGLSAGFQHQQTADSAQRSDQHLRPGDSDTAAPPNSPEQGEEEAFHCPYCYKRFRRHAYLRKHLLSHQHYGPLERGQLTYPCSLCGVHFPSMDIRDKHRLWHAVREELLLPLEEALVAEGGQQVYPCDMCPTAFFSSPGLSLHRNKCHPSEDRQEPPIPLGPGC